MKTATIVGWIFLWFIVWVVAGALIEQSNNDEVFFKREKQCFSLWWEYYRWNDSCWIIKQKEIRERIDTF